MRGSCIRRLDFHLLSSLALNFKNDFFSLGNGGNANRVKILYRKTIGQVDFKSCRGTGAEPARNGRGGRGKRFLMCFEIICTRSIKQSFLSCSFHGFI